MTPDHVAKIEVSARISSCHGGWGVAFDSCQLPLHDTRGNYRGCVVGTSFGHSRLVEPVGRVATILAAVAVIAGCTGTQQDGGPSVTEESTSATAAPLVELLDRVKIGDCLNWSAGIPDEAEVVDCAGDHRFEVVEVTDLSTFPGGEYGPDAAPPSANRIQQISQEHCSPAVQRYLGARFDPNSRFTVTMLWSGDEVWRDSGERRMLCGLQLPGPNNEQSAFQGRVADVDQSRVWPAGTCIGIDLSTSQPTDIPVDCAAPHAMEVTGSVDVGAQFLDAFPSEADQDGFVKNECTAITDTFLAPKPLRDTTLMVVYSTLSPASWAAGSRQVSCSVGATLGNGGWSTLVNSAKGPLLINGQPPAPPP